MPSSGEEIQSEFFVAREDATAVIAAIAPLAGSIQPLLLVCELRTVAQDSLWLSPQYRRRSTGIHFTWRRRQPEAQRLVAEIEARLAPFAPRPHWAKVFTARAAALAPRYERLSDFAALRDVFGSSRSVQQRLASLPSPRARGGIVKPRLPY